MRSHRSKETEVSKDLNQTVGEGTTVEMNAYPVGDLVFGHTWRNTDTNTLWIWTGVEWIDDQGIRPSQLTPVRESFPLPGAEGNIVMNIGDFWGSYQVLEKGVYTNVFAVVDVNSMGAATSEVRFGVYEAGAPQALLASGVRQITGADGVGVFDITLASPLTVTQNRIVYFVIGLNDNVGGGSVRFINATGNGINNPDILFKFNQPAGALPANLPAVAQDINVQYQVLYSL